MEGRDIIYEDDEVVVMKAPHDEELVDLVYKYIRQKGRPVTWRELREAFSGTAGEDRLRKALRKLREQGLVITDRSGYVLASLSKILERRRRRILREYRGRRARVLNL